ncbi:MAG: hypothetical protein DDG59_09945 [Anaerolineae bacterium]|jgi:hypothetical protein|nr:MAG: hypothetical protein DDG59_09945 [Anaerolineae bacterium]
MPPFSSRSIKFFLIVILFVASLACNLITGFFQNFEQVKSTVVSIATDAKGGQEAMATAYALATQLAGNQFVETAKAIATEVGKSGAAETLQAVITEQAPGIEETLQAFLTQNVPELEGTAKALLTQVPLPSTSPPDDIPIVQGDIQNLLTSNNTLTYQVSMPLADVVAFYKTEMPKKGWSFQPATSSELENASVLNFIKENRSASITISLNPINQKTMVVIVLQNP